MGNYENDNIASNGKEPIAWRVLANDGSKLLLLTSYAIDTKPYHTQKVDISWEKSTLRSWLNGYNASENAANIDSSTDNFLNSAFTADEKEKIIYSLVKAEKNPNYSSIDPGNDTKDYVFFISASDAENYFRTDGLDRGATATPYAIANGAITQEVSFKRSFRFLRTPGGSSDRVASVNPLGSIYYFGGEVNMTQYTIRPAIWVDLNKL